MLSMGTSWLVLPAFGKTEVTSWDELGRFISPDGAAGLGEVPPSP